MNKPTYKKCIKCNEENEIIENFYFRKVQNEYFNVCKLCVKKDTQKYRKNNKEKVLEYNKNYYEDNKSIILLQKKKYRNENGTKIIIKNNRYRKKRRQNDPSFRLREDVSRMINHSIKKYGSSKNGISCLKYFNYSIEELKQHLEIQFEPWMSWNNWGVYNSNTWDNNDSTTWTWQIDHIIPQSDLPYTSMQDENFKKCWSLENLRPLSAKQNNFDGVNNIRHKEVL
jgi:hypothetical protein